MPVRQHPIAKTKELARIRKLPRRTITKAVATKHAKAWSRVLALGPGVALKPWQGAALTEICESLRPGSGVLSLPVGIGKTLLASLLPVAIALYDAGFRVGSKAPPPNRYKALKSVLVTSASIRKQTFADRRSYHGVWRVAAPPPRFVSTAELARAENERLLWTLKPEVVILDESDELSNWDAAAVQRVHRYVTERRAKGYRVCVVSMTGTLSRKSILGYWHHLLWAFGPELAPVPGTRAEASAWAECLDHGKSRNGWRPRPGALGDTVQEARKWFRDRLGSTPGVLLVNEDSAEGVPLHISIALAPDCPRIESAFETLRTRWESPSGEPVSDALSVRRVAGDIGCGLFRYWDPPPPDEWVEARRSVARFIRAKIIASRRSVKPLDTDAQVMRAFPDAEPVKRWRAVKHLFDPLKSVKVEWISDTVVEAAAEWVTTKSKLGARALWYGNVPLGERVAKLTKLPCYGPSGVCIRTKRDLHQARKGHPMIVSWHANKRGFNLQAWPDNAIVQPPTSGKYFEQTLGRPHRQGQKKPVHWTIIATSGDTLDGFAETYSEAEFVASTTHYHQKILRATLAPLPDLPADTYRWAVDEEEGE